MSVLCVSEDFLCLLPSSFSAPPQPSAGPQRLKLGSAHLVSASPADPCAAPPAGGRLGAVRLRSEKGPSLVCLPAVGFLAVPVSSPWNTVYPGSNGSPCTAVLSSPAVFHHVHNPPCAILRAMRQPAARPLSSALRGSLLQAQRTHRVAPAEQLDQSPLLQLCRSPPLRLHTVIVPTFPFAL